MEKDLVMYSELCKNCGKRKGRHKAVDYNCPIGRGNYTSYYLEQFFEPKKKRKKKKKA